VRNEVLRRVKEQRNILHEISKRKANLIGHILRINCLIWKVIEGKIKGWIEVTGGRGRKRRKLLDDLKERREYPHLKEKALDRAMWRAGFGRGFGPVVRQTTEWMNEETSCDGEWAYSVHGTAMTVYLFLFVSSPLTLSLRFWLAFGFPCENVTQPKLTNNLYVYRYCQPDFSIHWWTL
jgi:hypothetical protein